MSAISFEKSIESRERTSAVFFRVQTRERAGQQRTAAPLLRRRRAEPGRDLALAADAEARGALLLLLGLADEEGAAEGVGVRLAERPAEREEAADDEVERLELVEVGRLEERRLGDAEALVGWWRREGGQMR